MKPVIKFSITYNSNQYIVIGYLYKTTPFIAHSLFFVLISFLKAIYVSG